MAWFEKTFSVNMISKDVCEYINVNKQIMGKYPSYKCVYETESV